MADTFGDLIDNLIIANIRLWHIEDEKRESINLLSQDNENTAKLNEKIVYLSQMVNKTNAERNNLIDRINASLRVIADYKIEQVSSVSLDIEDILGRGKNKFYKTEDY